MNELQTPPGRRAPPAAFPGRAKLSPQRIGMVHGSFTKSFNGRARMRLYLLLIMSAQRGGPFGRRPRPFRGRGVTMSVLARFVLDESGATSVEYGLIAVCISVAIVTVLQGVAAKLGDTFYYVRNDLN